MASKHLIGIRLLLGLFVLLVGTPQASAGSLACGLDYLGICNAARTLAPVIDKLPARARDAADAVADNLFNHLLPPAIDKVTASAESIERKARAEFEQGLNATSTAVYDLATKALQLTEKLAANLTKDIEEIVQEVQSDISDDIDQLFKDIDYTVAMFLHQLELEGQEVFCAVQHYADSFEQQMSSYFQAQDCDCVQQMLALNPGLKQDCKCTSCFHIGGFYPECPCKPWSFQFTSIYAKSKYQFLKCHLEKVIDYKNWNHDQIISQLQIIQGAALGFRCMEDFTGSSSLRDYFWRLQKGPGLWNQRKTYHIP